MYLSLDYIGILYYWLSHNNSTDKLRHDRNCIRNILEIVTRSPHLVLYRFWAYRVSSEPVWIYVESSCSFWIQHRLGGLGYQNTFWSLAKRCFYELSPHEDKFPAIRSLTPMGWTSYIVGPIFCKVSAAMTQNVRIKPIPTTVNTQNTPNTPTASNGSGVAKRFCNINDIACYNGLRDRPMWEPEWTDNGHHNGSCPPKFEPFRAHHTQSIQLMFTTSPKMLATHNLGVL